MRDRTNVKEEENSENGRERRSDPENDNVRERLIIQRRRRIFQINSDTGRGERATRRGGMRGRKNAKE